MCLVGLISDLWSKPGVSEFASAALGGLMTILAQWVALRHDRKKEDGRIRDKQRALAWAIFFKIHHVFEALTHIKNDIESDEIKANANGVELWQIYQSPVHDVNLVNWETEELMIFIDAKQLSLMQKYQSSISWLSNLVQSTKMYRELRVDFLSSTPAKVEGTTGTIEVKNEEAVRIMPRIAHLRSLSDSILNVVKSQQPDVRALLEGYVAIMKPIAGSAPVMELSVVDTEQVVS